VRYITAASISKFRSIASINLPTLGDFSVLAGLNNSGKSNVLRALHLFFSDDVEPGLRLAFSRDFYRPDLASKKRKRISVDVSFDLPPTFKFRKGLEPSKTLLGTQFTIRKEWGPDTNLPEYFLNGGPTALSLDPRWPPQTAPLMATQTAPPDLGKTGRL
jgi:chromosome segregation ATPase